MSRTYRRKKHKQLVRDSFYYIFGHWAPYDADDVIKQRGNYSNFQDGNYYKPTGNLKRHSNSLRRSLEKQELRKLENGFIESEKVLKKLRWKWY